jgi:hypothetical protein
MKIWLPIVALASACTTSDVDVGESPEGSDYAYCAAPDGPTHSYATAGEAAALVTATWIYCSGDVLDGSTQVGIAFGADHIFRDLEDEGGGNVVEVAGTSADAWAVAQSATRIELLVTTELSGNELDEVWSMTFEDAPRKLLVTRDGDSEPSIYAIAP